METKRKREEETSVQITANKSAGPPISRATFTGPYAPPTKTKPRLARMRNALSAHVPFITNCTIFDSVPADRELDEKSGDRASNAHAPTLHS